MLDPRLLDVVAQATESDRPLSDLVAPLLDLLAELSGLETTFLTAIDPVTDEQELRQLHRSDGSDASALAGFRIPWEDTLCKVSLERGTPWMPDVPALLPDHIAWKVAGWRTYFSVPIRLPGEDAVHGTLCGAAVDTLPEREDVVRIFELFSRLIADHIGRGRAADVAGVRADEAERALADRLEFVAMAEHALKNPLQLITGWTELLIEKGDRLTPELQAESLVRVRNAAVRMREQVDAMLSETRAGAISGEGRREDVDLTPFLVGLADDWTTATGTSVEVADGVAAVVHLDPRVLRIILEHLLENATSFVRSDGRIVLSVDGEGGRVVVHVDDDGPGLPDELDVFAPFSRDGDRGTRVGVGLGLYVVRQLVENEGGTVATACSPLGGARFTVELPAV